MFHPAHLFIPHKKNNYRAHLLKTPALYSMIAMLLVVQLSLTLLNRAFPTVLGMSHSITSGDIVNLTNDERGKLGLPALRANGQLTVAAQKKGEDMLAKGYWAHVSPDGKQPWAFIREAGYSYERAGENLAKDFTDSTSAVRAWMNSPGHRANIVNVYYQEIGVAVVSGAMNGSDTVIVVQMFGQPIGGTLADRVRDPAGAQAAAPALPQPRGLSVSETVPSRAQLPSLESDSPQGVSFNGELRLEDQTETTNNPIINPRDIMRALALVIGSILIILLTIDIMAVTKQRLQRTAHGHTTLHLIFVIFMLISIFIVQVGVIL